MDILMESSKDKEEIIATEAVIESLSLTTLGDRSTIAIIGVDNYVILDAIAASGKKVAIALNNDLPKSDGSMGPGQKATAKLLKFFQEKGIAARNFTEEFLANHQEVAWTDFNEYLKNLSVLKTQ